MKKIWKYSLELGENIIEMPIGSKIVSAKLLPCGIAIWVEVKPINTMVKRKIMVYETGAELSSYPGEFVATITSDCHKAFHVYAYAKESL